MSEIHSFRSFDDVNEWLDRVEASTSVSVSSGFAPGVALAHCAQSIELQCSGYPELKPAAIRRTVGVLVKNRFVAKGSMSHGTDAPIPGAAPLGEVSVEQGVARLRGAIDSFRNHHKGMAEHFVYGRVDKITAEMLQAMHIANHADRITL